MPLQLAMNSDFRHPIKEVEAQLDELAAAGFQHVHWCHHWFSDHLYTGEEIAHLRRTLEARGMQLAGVHASEGNGALWNGEDAEARAPGIQLVENRLELAARLETDFVVLHIPSVPGGSQEADFWKRVEGALSPLEARAETLGVRIALENLPWNNLRTLEGVCRRFHGPTIGICYDSGHALLAGNGVSALQRLGDRLIGVHLHDNDGSGDQHRLPFSGTVSWEAITGCLAALGYKGFVTLEVHEEDRQAGPAFAAAAYTEAVRLREMIESGAGGGGGGAS